MLFLRQTFFIAKIKVVFILIKLSTQKKMNYIRHTLNNKKIISLFLLLMGLQLSSCAKLNDDILTAISVEKTCYIKKEQYSGVRPEWYQNFKYDKKFFHVIKNYERSTQKDLARQKNILIAKMRISNLANKEFMNCDDQRQMVFHVRGSKSTKEISKFQESKLIEQLTSEVSIEKEEIIEKNKVFTSFIILSLPKK